MLHTRANGEQVSTLELPATLLASFIFNLSLNCLETYKLTQKFNFHLSVHNS